MENPFRFSTRRIPVQDDDSISLVLLNFKFTKLDRYAGMVWVRVLRYETRYQFQPSDFCLGKVAATFRWNADWQLLLMPGGTLAIKVGTNKVNGIDGDSVFHFVVIPSEWNLVHVSLWGAMIMLALSIY